MNAKLEQKNLFGLRQTFEISDRLLIVTVSGLFRLENWDVPLETIDPSPTRVRKCDFKPLLLAIPYTLLTLLCLIVTIDYLIKLQFNAALIVGAATTICGFIAATRCFKMYSKMINVLQFAGSTGVRLPLWFNNPSKQKFEAFVIAFKAAIIAAQTVQPVDHLLAGEIQSLKNLFDQGLLDEAQFESAKDKLTNKILKISF